MIDEREPTVKIAPLRLSEVEWQRRARTRLFQAIEALDVAGHAVGYALKLAKEALENMPDA